MVPGVTTQYMAGELGWVEKWMHWAMYKWMNDLITDLIATLKFHVSDPLSSK